MKPVTIIALTANGSASSRQQCLDAGLNARLVKPERDETASYGAGLRTLREACARALAAFEEAV